jgi:hypothetical protein
VEIKIPRRSSGLYDAEYAEYFVFLKPVFRAMLGSAT